KANDAAFKACLQGLCHLNASNAVAVCLQFEYVGTDHFFTLEPVVSHAYCPTLVVKNMFCLIGKLAQLRRISATEPRLNAPAAPRAQQKLLGNSVGVRIFLVQMFLDSGHQSIDLLRVVDVHEELSKGPVFPFWSVDEHEAQAATSDERRNMGDARQSLDVLL